MFRARLGKATLDEFDDDLLPYAKQAEKDFFCGKLAEENWYRVGMWFDSVDEHYESASNPDFTIREKQVKQSPLITRLPTNVNQPGPRDSKPQTLHVPNKPPLSQDQLAQMAANIDRRYELVQNARHRQPFEDPVTKRPPQPTDAGNTNEWEEMARTIGNPPGLPTQADAN